MTKATVTFLVLFVLVLGWWILLKKPTCRDGYVALWGPYDGWNCITGYKP